MRLFSLPSSVILHFAAYSLLLLAMKAVPNGPFVLVVSDPRGGPGQSATIISRADGRIVQGTRLPWAMVATSEAPDFPSRLRSAGALAVFNFPGSAGCVQRGKS